MNNANNLISKYLPIECRNSCHSQLRTFVAIVFRLTQRWSMPIHNLLYCWLRDFQAALQSFVFNSYYGKSDNFYIYLLTLSQSQIDENYTSNVCSNGQTSVKLKYFIIRRKSNEVTSFTISMVRSPSDPCTSKMHTFPLFLAHFKPIVKIYSSLDGSYISQTHVIVSH